MSLGKKKEESKVVDENFDTKQCRGREHGPQCNGRSLLGNKVRRRNEQYAEGYASRSLT